MWGKQADAPLRGLCLDCRASRVGEIINFTRFGKPPRHASINHRDRTAEAGISVYENDPDGQPIFEGWHFEISKRQEYQGCGKIIGWGSDGEPLVQIIRIRKVCIRSAP